MKDACARLADEDWSEDLDDPVSGPVVIAGPSASSVEDPVSGPVATWGRRAPSRSSSARAEEITRSYDDPGADPFADTVLWFGTGDAKRRPEWCVDLGSVLLTMTTFELWTSVERGDLAHETRVWREGMECWTGIGQLPEFSWAVPGSKSPAPVRVDASEGSGSAGDVADAMTGPLAQRPRGRGADDADGDLRPAGVPSRQWWSPRRLVRKLPRGARWIALGSAIAVGAVLAALLAEGSADEAASADGATMAVTAPTAATVDAEVGAIVGAPTIGGGAGMARAADRSREGAAERPVDRPEPRAVVHEEPGRHRLRRGPKRGYGW